MCFRILGSADPQIPCEKILLKLLSDLPSDETPLRPVGHSQIRPIYYCRAAPGLEGSVALSKLSKHLLRKLKLKWDSCSNSDLYSKVISIYAWICTFYCVLQFLFKTEVDLDCRCVWSCTHTFWPAPVLREMLSQ